MVTLATNTNRLDRCAVYLCIIYVSKITTLIFHHYHLRLSKHPNLFAVYKNKVVKNLSLVVLSTTTYTHLLQRHLEDSHQAQRYM
jgi:hypothetical protein